MHASARTPDTKRRVTFGGQDWKLLAHSSLWTRSPDTWKSVMVWMVSNIQNSKYRYRNQILMVAPTTTKKKKKITSQISLLPRTFTQPHLILQVTSAIDVVLATCFWVCQFCPIPQLFNIQNGHNTLYLKCLLKDEKWQCSTWKKITKEIWVLVLTPPLVSNTTLEKQFHLTTPQ